MNNDIREISLDLIDEPAQAMRTDIDRDAIFELSADIKKNGLINPITVRLVCNTGKRDEPLHVYDRTCVSLDHVLRFEVVAGHRRFLAHRYGGMPTIKCIVRDLGDDEAFTIMSSENYARTDTSLIDDAAHCAKLMQIHNGDIDKVCDIVGHKRGWVEDRLTIGEMPEYLRAALRDGQVKLGVALALNQIGDDIDRQAVLQMAISQGASVVMAQYWLAQWNAGLFGHATGQLEPEVNGEIGRPRVVMLRCSIQDKDFPADECRSVILHSSSLPYVYAMRDQLKLETPNSNLSGGGNQESADGER